MNLLNAFYYIKILRQMENEVYKLAERSNIEIREIDFENIYLL